MRRAPRAQSSHEADPPAPHLPPGLREADRAGGGARRAQAPSKGAAEGLIEGTSDAPHRDNFSGHWTTAGESSGRERPRADLPDRYRRRFHSSGKRLRGLAEGLVLIST